MDDGGTVYPAFNNDIPYHLTASGNVSFNSGSTFIEGIFYGRTWLHL